MDDGRAEVVSDVQAALVATKLALPLPVPGLLPRVDLVERLARSPAKLCLIDAPAGWGKTSLLAAWHAAETGRRPFAFLDLEPSDDDAPVFWTYVVAALRTVYPGLLAGADEALRTPGMEPMRRVVPDLVNELYELDEPVVLVLDDYHVLTQERIHASVLYLIERLPPKARLVLATRSDPPLPLGRLRASGEMIEIRARQLGFSESEASQLLEDRFGLAMDTTSVRLLCERTEGWPAALQLAGLSLEGEADRPGFVRQFAGDDRNVADYLASEALGQLSDARRRFLLRTSVLDHLTGPLCDAVVGISGSAAILEELEHDNLFLVPLDNRRDWYRYHHLFGEWLRHELQRTEPDCIGELHASASRWHAQHGSLEPAISHAIAAGEHESAATLLDRYLLHPSGINFTSTWRWLHSLPDEVAAKHPVIASMHIWFATATGDFSTGHHWMAVAEAAVDEVPADLRPRVETIVALYRAFGHLTGDDREAARVGFEAIAEQERPTGSSTYAMAIGLAGMATFWSLGAREAIPALREGALARERLSLSDGGTTALLGLAYAEIGDQTAAEAAAEKAFGLPPRWEGYRFPDAMAAHYALGKVLIARGEREQGAVRTRQGLALARGWVEPLFVAYGCLVLADALDDYTEKRALVREARRLVEGSPDPGRTRDLVAAAERKLSIRRPGQQTASTAHIEPLTERELDVLRMLRSELSLREIAGELYVSYHTVKGHTKSIYRKLGVSSREAAVGTARELDLL